MCVKNQLLEMLSPLVDVMTDLKCYNMMLLKDKALTVCKFSVAEGNLGVLS